MLIVKKTKKINSNYPFNLDQKIALITGGASGIGFATAQIFVAAGAKVVLLDLPKSNVKEAAKKISLDTHICSGISLDITAETDVKNSLEKIFKEKKSIDILVNSAGTAIRKPAITLPLKDWNKVVNVNMTGCFICSRVAARLMSKGKHGGVIINIASIMGLSGGGLYPNISYQTTKGAIINMTRAMAVEWATKGIRVNAVAPTYVRTPFIKSLLTQPKLIKKIESMTPLNRIAEPEEVASAILFLSSPGASMITGHTLPVDGGFLAQ